MIYRTVVRLLLVIWLLVTLVACQVQNPLTAPTPTPPSPTETVPPAVEPEPNPDSPAGFDAFLQQLDVVPLGQRQIAVDRYVAQLGETPITGDRQAILLWRGDAMKVELVGDMNNWNLGKASALTRVAGTDLWFLVGEFEADARLDYQFVIDGNEWQLDPLNSQIVRSKDGPNSELVMPAYDQPAELNPAESTVPRGAVTAHTIESAYLDQTRTFFVYVPAGQIVGERLPTIYVNNGSDYLNLIEAPEILDQLIAQRQIPPLVTVFIPPINPAEEYLVSDNYVNFVADELVPFVQEEYSTDSDPKKTGTMGVSLGGLAAVYTAASRPNIFGLTASLSGVFSIEQKQQLMQKLARAAKDIRLYQTVGIYETAIDAASAGDNSLDANRQLAISLARFDYDYVFEERSEGHSWGLWRSAFGRALRFLYAAE